MYTNKELVRLLGFGIEGEHYELVDADTYRLPEGMTAANSPYPCDQPYMYANMWFYLMEEGADLTMDKVQQFTADATPYSCLGFIYDSSNVKNEVAACNSVVSKYNVGLTKGLTDPATELPKFIEELKDAGLDLIIEEKQAQYEAWKAQQ